MKEITKPKQVKISKQQTKITKALGLITEVVGAFLSSLGEQGEASPLHWQGKARFASWSHDMAPDPSKTSARAAGHSREETVRQP